MKPTAGEPPSPPASLSDMPAGLGQQLDDLGGQLVWRMGKSDLSDEVVVRLGLASAARRFAELPRLRSLSDDELKSALETGQITVEWVEG